jgi:hypothetical protein
MWKRINNIFVGIVTLVLIIFLGCATVQDAITPCVINPELLADVNDTGMSFVPFTTVYDADRVLRKYDYLYNLEKFTIDLRYGYLRDDQMLNLTSARQFQQQVFSPTGAIGLMFPAVAGLMLGGRYIKRPEEKELEKKINGNSTT